MKIKNIEHLDFKESLPSPKGVALAITQMCQKEDCSIHEITKLIQTDPTLSYRLIRRANLIRQTTRAITSVHDAVLHLGLIAVKQLALSFSLIDQYQQGYCKSFDFQKFWSHSLLMAIALETFGGVIRISVREELFACGLLARIGCLALATVYPEKYSAILEKHDPKTPLTMLENRCFGIDHNEMTAAMLDDAGFTTALTEPIYYHEEPLESGFLEESRAYQLTQLFHLAKIVADQAMNAESEQEEQSAELILLAKKLGLEMNLFVDLNKQIIQEWQAWKTLLTIPDTAFPSLQTINKTIEKYIEDTPEPSSLRVLVVEDESPSRILIQKILSDILGHSVYSAENGQQGLSLALEITPHVIITDWLMPVMNGLELTQALRTTEVGQKMYIIMLTNLEDEEKITDAFEAGVDDYITKPINIRIFRARLRAAWHYRRLQESWEQDQSQLKQFAAELALSNRKLEQAALTDILTELPNRRAGLEALTRTWNASNRSNHLMATLLIDIDHFKSINDKYGHDIGDAVLKEVATTIHSIARSGDFFCRLGGEEFLVICQDKNTDEKSIIIFAERLRKQVSNKLITATHKAIHVTISIGIALKEPTINNAEQLVKAADRALYAAKAAGRNKVFFIKKGQIIEC